MHRGSRAAQTPGVARQVLMEWCKDGQVTTILPQTHARAHANKDTHTNTDVNTHTHTPRHARAHTQRHNRQPRETHAQRPDATDRDDFTSPSRS